MHHSRYEIAPNPPQFCAVNHRFIPGSIATCGNLWKNRDEFKLLAKGASPSRKTAPKDYNFAERRGAHVSTQTVLIRELASVDPGTMKIREYVLPAADARPRRIAVAPDGTIYYTDFARGYLGHFDPSAGKLLKEWSSPGGSESEPYGIAITSDREVWYSESGVKPNTLVRFDPKSESFSRKPIPSGGGVVRNMVATPGGQLYLAYSGVNKVAVVNLNR
jgi:DNA-binding beta-propeller fold protein YncE